MVTLPPTFFSVVPNENVTRLAAVIVNVDPTLIMAGNENDVTVANVPANVVPTVASALKLIDVAAASVSANDVSHNASAGNVNVVKDGIVRFI